MYSNCCCRCSFEPEIIKIGQLSHKMYSNNIVNFQECTTILNACTKKIWKPIECTTYHLVVWSSFNLLNNNFYPMVPSIVLFFDLFSISDYNIINCYIFLHKIDTSYFIVIINFHFNIIGLWDVVLCYYSKIFSFSFDVSLSWSHSIFCVQLR